MSSAPPLCRYCGKPLAKRTSSHYVKNDKYGEPFIDSPKTKADCQKLTNETVISVAYHKRLRDGSGARHVWHYSTWDGESYESVYGAGFFCTQVCAVHFANLHAKEGQSTSVYVAALMKQREKLKLLATVGE
jgi:hypothetical protein